MTEALIELSAEELRARRGKKWREYAADIYPAWVADMDFLTAEPVRRALQEMANDGDFVYSSLLGSTADAFAERMHQRFGWGVRPEHTTLVADLVQGVTASLLAYSRPGDGILLTSPSYPPLTGAVAATGRRLVDVPLLESADGYALDTAGIRRALARENVAVLVLCNPHNPTGHVMDRTELTELAAAATDAGVIVVSDEIHCDLVYPGREHIPYASVDTAAAALTVSLHSATKSFNLGGLRCGVLHFGSAQLMEAFQRANPDRLLGRVNSFGAVATTVAWRHGHSWMDSLLVRLQENRQRLMDWAANRPGVTVYQPEGTYFAWLDCSGLDLAGGSAAEFFLHRARVALSPGVEFGLAFQACVRLNFATSATILDEILGRLDGAIGHTDESDACRPVADSVRAAVSEQL